MERNNELLQSFEDCGLLYQYVMGMEESDEGVIRFFLAENELLNLTALRGMYDFAFDHNLTFVGVNVERNRENIVVDEFFETNDSFFDGDVCMVVIFKREQS